MHPHSVIVALGCLPPTPLLNHISTITSPAPTTSTSYPTTSMATKVTTVSKADNSLETPHAVFIGQGLPPVPKKLASKIESGKFVDMSELLPDHLGCSETSISGIIVGELSPKKSSSEYPRMDPMLQYLHFHNSSEQP